MSKKQEEQLRQLTDQVLRLAWKIAEKKDSPGPNRQPPLVKARYESIVAFRSTALVMRAILKLEPGRACGQ